MIHSFAQAAIVIFGLVTLLWSISVYLKDVSIVDIFWGFGLVVINAIYFFNIEDITPRNIILFVLVTAWGLRLTVYLAIRNIGKPEDFRYQGFRKHYGEKRYWWLSYIQVFLLQGCLMLLISVTLLGAHYGQQYEFGIIDYFACCMWLIGFIFETGGDYQMTHFKKKSSNKGKVLNTGFWKYTRHPNYFGDTMVWWSYALFCIASHQYTLIFGTAIMTFVIIKISGVNRLDNALTKSKPQYKQYIESTSAFIPWIKKKD